MNSTQAIYLLEKPIPTIYGNVGYLHIDDYFDFSGEISTISKTPLHMYYDFRKQLAKVPLGERKQFLKEIDELKSKSLFELLNEDTRVFETYARIFNKVIDYNEGYSFADVIESESNFMTLRKMIMEMNYIKEEPVSPNPEIQEYYEQRKKLKQKETGEIDFSDIISSVAVGGNYKYHEIGSMTIFQFYNTYYRIGSFKKYDQSTIFASAFHDTKILTSWSEKIDLFEEESLGYNYNDFNKKYNDIMG